MNYYKHFQVQFSLEHPVYTSTSTQAKYFRSTSKFANFTIRLSKYMEILKCW